MRDNKLGVIAICPRCESQNTVHWGGMGNEAYFRCLQIVKHSPEGCVSVRVEDCGWDFSVAIVKGKFVYRVRSEL